jgi:hypothetical protein
MANRRVKKKREDEGGMAFVGFLFLGMAVGAIYGRWDIGPFLGLGLGFIAMAIIRMRN